MTSSERPDAQPDTLLVFTDSLGHYGPKGGLPADDPRLWPNLVAEELGLRPELIARVGWTSRDVWWSLTQDPRVWAAMPRTAAVILGIGGMDSLPSPLPTSLRELMRYVRPDGLRRRVRSAYLKAQPRLAPLGWPMALPPDVTVAYLEQCREAIAAVRPGIPIIGITTPSHWCADYGFAHPGWKRTADAVREWADAKGVPLAPHYELSFPHLRAGNGNPDGIHWSFDVHRDVAGETAAVLRRALAGAGR